MTTVTGKLETITGSPSQATRVWVRATHAGPITGGVMTEEQVPVDYNPTTGMVSFTATAGTSGMLVVGRSMSYPIIIPDKPTATLREVVENATRYPPVVVTESITAIREARDEALVVISSARLAALSQVNTAVATAVTAQMGTKADKKQVDQLTGQVMSALGMGATALRRTKN